eukprot:5697642-Amphidinium_carterae.1
MWALGHIGRPGAIPFCQLQVPTVYHPVEERQRSTTTSTRSRSAEDASETVDVSGGQARSPEPQANSKLLLYELLPLILQTHSFSAFFHRAEATVESGKNYSERPAPLNSPF